MTPLITTQEPPSFADRRQAPALGMASPSAPGLQASAPQAGARSAGPVRSGSSLFRDCFEGYTMIYIYICIYIYNRHKKQRANPTNSKC